MARNERPQVIAPEDLSRVAKMLQHFADRYTGLAQSLAAERLFSQLTVRNWRSMENALQDLQRSVNKAYEAYDLALMDCMRKNQTDGKTNDLDPQRLVDSAVREDKFARKRKTVRKSSE